MELVRMGLWSFRRFFCLTCHKYWCRVIEPFSLQLKVSIDIFPDAERALARKLRVPPGPLRRLLQN
jgi:hypothetical protein